MQAPLRVVLLILFSALFPWSSLAGTQPRTIVVLGDSLTAGYGLEQDSAFPAQLETALKRRGYEVRVINAGVSGDTSAGGAARLEWSLADRPDLMLIELGGNDALRGLNPQQTRQNLATILSRLNKEQIRTILTGMQAPRNLGESYYSSFDRLYPELAKEFDVAFYPFFLDGVVGRPELNLADGIHPNRTGVAVIVERLLPLVEQELQALEEIPR